MFESASRPEEVEPEPAWRVVLAIVSFLVGLLVAASIGSAVVVAGGWDPDVPATIGSEIGRTAGQFAADLPLDDLRIPLGIALLLNIPLWAALVGGPLWATRRGLSFRDHLAWSMRWTDIPLGLGIGVLTQLVVLPAVYVPVFAIWGSQDVEATARSLVAAVDSPFDVAALLALTIVGAPIAEEILYRGLLHRGLVDLGGGRAGLAGAYLISAAVFAASHFQLLQFPGLFVFGLVAAAAMHATGRLGTAIWTHVGFNATAVAALLGDLG